MKRVFLIGVIAAAFLGTGERAYAGACLSPEEAQNLYVQIAYEKRLRRNNQIDYPVGDKSAVEGEIEAVHTETEARWLLR